MTEKKGLTEKIAPGFDLMQPEILDVRVIAKHLQKNIVGPKDFDTSSKDELLELYYAFVLPFPQRQYRGNRKGQKLTMKQRSIDKLKNRQVAHESSLLEDARRRNEGKLPFEMDTSLSNRLKPPPNISQGRRLLNPIKRKAETSLEDIIIHSKPRKNDAFTHQPKSVKKKVTLAKLVEEKTSLDNVIVRNKTTHIGDGDHSNSDSKNGTVDNSQRKENLLSLKPPPPKPRRDSLSHVVIKEYVKKDKSTDSIATTITTGKRESNFAMEAQEPKIPKHEIISVSEKCVEQETGMKCVEKTLSQPIERKKLKLKRPSS